MNYMNFSLDNFINSTNIGTDKTLQIRDKSGVLKYTLTPFQINTYYVNNNIIKIHFKSSDDIIELDFRTPLEAKEALKKLQQELDKFKDVVPNVIYEDIQNYINDRILSITYSGGGGFGLRSNGCNRIWTTGSVGLKFGVTEQQVQISFLDLKIYNIKKFLSIDVDKILLVSSGYIINFIYLSF